MTIPVEASLPVSIRGGDGRLRYLAPAEIATRARDMELAGIAGLFTAETNVEPFLALGIAAGSTSSVELGTSIAVELARSPMTTAQLAHQLQGLTAGRFVLGLGSQIKPHIVRRFGMPWDKPIARMEAHIDAIRAIWACWRDGTKIDIRNEFFTIDLMPESFVPPPHDHPDPPIMLAAVGPAMTRLAARKADGIFAHAFTTIPYLSEVTVPTLRAELASYSRRREDFRVQGSVMAAIGDTDEELEVSVDALRRRIAFYASTPAYHAVLEHHGWEELGKELHRLSRTDDPRKWDAMAMLVPDDVLQAFGIVGSRDRVLAEAQRRFAGLVDRLRVDDLLAAA